MFGRRGGSFGACAPGALLLSSPALCRPSLPRSARSFAPERKLSAFHSIRDTLFVCLPAMTPGALLSSPSPLLTHHSPLSSLESTLVDDLRVGFQGLYLQTLTRQPTEISRNCLPATLLGSTFTDPCTCKPFIRNTYKNMGRGESSRWRVSIAASTQGLSQRRATPGGP